MKTTRGRARWLTRITWCAAALALSVAVPSVAAAVPTAPSVKDATVYQGGTGVTIWWTPSTDTQAGAIQYQVYRDDVPMTISNYLANGELVTTTSDTTVTVTPKADELTKKFTYYYMVVATNTTTGSKAVSSNIAPNVHGGLRSGYQTYNCQLCHSVHGAPPQNYLGAATRYRCYRCHGNTSGSTNYGDKAVRNVQRDFFDYTSGQTIPTTVSRHYNAYMETNETECTSCHTPHKSPYYVDPATGVKLDASSYTQLLRAEITAGNYYYSTDAAPSGNAFCLQCHGSSSGAIEFNGGPGTYKATAGDHTYAANAVHNETVVYTNNDNHATNPGIQCEACHNKHASAVDKLIDYRGSGTSSTENNQAGLCYKCHRAGTTENRIAAGYAAPYAWNGRDLYAQFAKAASGGSSHPTTAGSGRWTPDSGQVFSQDTNTEFASDTLSHTVVNTADGDGSVALNQYTMTIDPPAQPVVWAHEGGSTTFDEYTIGSSAWNDLLNPDDHDGANGNTNFSPATGSSSFVLNGKLYTTVAGGASALFHEFNPTTDATGDWNQVGVTLNGNIGTGGDTAVGANGVVYFSRGGGNSDIYWWNSGTGTENGFATTTNGTTAQTLGQGSAMAYAPAAARLFVINTSNGTGDEYLRWVANPGTTTTSQTFATNNISMVDAGSWARMVCATSGASNTEYLFAITRQGGVNKLIVISNLSGTPSATSVAVWPTGWGNLGDGCDLVWDGVNGGYLYATIGGNQSGFARIDIPDNPTVAGNWGAWEPLTQITTAPWDTTPWAIGSSIAVMPYDPPSYNTTYYYDSGTVTTAVDVNPVADSTGWGTVSWTETLPANTDISVKVQGWNGSAWVDLVTGSTSPIDISSYSIATYTKLRLVGTLSTTAPLTSTPLLTSWTVTSTKAVWQARGSLTCVNCHNTHTVARGGTTPWDMTRVSNPNSTKNAYTGTPTQFCLECHDASAPTTALNDANVLVPYDVGFTDKSAYPFFPGWNKTATGADWAGGGHATTAIKELAGDIGCDTCHDPHASDNARLTAYSFDQTGANPRHTGTVQRDNSSTYAEQRLCYACHDNTKTGMCNSAGCHATSLAFLNAQTPFAATYRHPVELTGKHSDLESGTSGFGSANRHAECADCHDPHATARGVHTAGDSSPGNALRGATGIKVTSWPANWTAVSADSWVTERMTGEDADYEAYVCFKCHSSYSGQPFSVTSGSGTYTSTDVAMEFNPSNMSEHNVLGQRFVMEEAFTVGGNPYTWTKPADSAFLKTGLTSNSQVTCTDCHSNTATTAARGPHGSSVPWLLDPAYPTDWKTVYLANTTTEGMNNNTNICAKCHTNLRTANNVHSTGDHQGNFTDGGCVQCHIKIPHGWKRPRLLGYSSDPASYSAGALAGIQLKSYTPTGWQKSNCAQSGCGEHSATVTPLWP